MNSEMREVRTDVEEDDFDDFDDDIDGESSLDDDDDSSDNVGDASVEINVEELINELEGSADMCSARKREIRRRLEELAEEKSLEDTYAIDFDD
jgi:chaperonin cofactor prefoldin